MNPPESPGPPPESRRRFTLIDGMALVAACAVGSAIPRLYDWAISGLDRGPFVISPAYDWYNIGLCWAMIASASLALLAAFGPRPPGARRFARPGEVAMLMAPLCWAHALWKKGVIDVSRPLFPGPSIHFGRYDWTFDVAYAGANATTIAILASWTTLLLVGAWRPAADWLDRSGRLLGGLWIAYGLLDWFVTCLLSR